MTSPNEPESEEDAAAQAIQDPVTREVWRLHCANLSDYAIAAAMGFDSMATLSFHKGQALSLMASWLRQQTDWQRYEAELRGEKERNKITVAQGSDVWDVDELPRNDALRCRIRPVEEPRE